MEDASPSSDPRSAPPRELATRLYDELRALARRELAGERIDHTLQPTALAHEAYLRLASDSSEFENDAHFFGAAARAIRRTLVDHARRRASLRRGGDRRRVDVDDVAASEDARWIALDEALERLAERSPDQARIVELRFFAGMGVEEIARSLATSESSVKRGWRIAKAWLHEELDDRGF